MFAIFRRNYHNQYFKAFPSEQDASVAKRLWLESLTRFNDAIILQGAKSLIETSEFLPTLAAMIKHCEKQRNRDLPDAHRAYIEACNAPSPKNEFEWSHPAVYHAGKKSDWFFIQNSNEAIAFPVFKKVYEEICQQIMQGIQYDTPAKLALPEETEHRLDKKSNLAHLKELKEKLDF
ncbi:MAG: hypothetical protein K6L76_11860 [Agarilytica sp.]